MSKYSDTLELVANLLDELSDWISADDETARTMRESIVRLRELNKELAWIDAKVSKPEACCEVIVGSERTGEVGVATWYPSSAWFDSHIHDVTHWKHFPDAPKKELA